MLLILGVGGWLAWALWLPVTPEGQKFVMLRPGYSTRRIAAELLGQYGSLEAALADGRFATLADDLRLYREIATMDAAAPLPPLAAAPPDWARAAAKAKELGLGALSARLAEHVS